MLLSPEVNNFVVTHVIHRWSVSQVMLAAMKELCSKMTGKDSERLLDDSDVIRGGVDAIDTGHGKPATRLNGLHGLLWGLMSWVRCASVPIRLYAVWQRRGFHVPSDICDSVLTFKFGNRPQIM